MPYRLRDTCVQQQTDDTWRDLKCHPDKAAAQAHLAALQINVEDAKAMAKKPPQEVVKALYELAMRADGESAYAFDSGEAADWVLYGLRKLGYLEDVLDMDAEEVLVMVGEIEKSTEQPTDAAQADKGYVKYSQSEVKYGANEGTLNPRSQACSTCRWFHRLYEDGQYLGHDCQIVDSYPSEILPTGWCDQWAKTPQTEAAVLQTIQPVVIVEDIEVEIEMPEMEVGMMAHTPGLLERLQDAIKGVFKRPDEPFTAFKALGNGKWFAVFSNNFLDRDGEIITEKAWERYVARVQSGFVPMPELWLAHIRGTKHGQAQWVGQAGHMIWAAGKFDETPVGRAAEKYYKSQQDITMSHAFMYPVWAKKRDDLPDGVKAVYEDLSVFEITTLHPGEEANPFTDFKTLEELEAMPISDSERARIKDVFGSEADKVLAKAEAAEKAGEVFREIGTAYKSYVDMTAPEESAEKGKVDLIGGELLGAVLEAQGDVASALKGIEGFTKAVEKAASDKTAALERRVKELEALFESTKTARPASEADKTVVNDSSVDFDKLPEEVKAAIKAIQAKSTGGSKDTVESIILGGN